MSDEDETLLTFDALDGSRYTCALLFEPAARPPVYVSRAGCLPCSDLLIELPGWHHRVRRSSTALAALLTSLAEQGIGPLPELDVARATWLGAEDYVQQVLNSLLRLPAAQPALETWLSLEREPPTVSRQQQPPPSPAGGHRSRPLLLIGGAAHSANSEIIRAVEVAVVLRGTDGPCPRYGVAYIRWGGLNGWTYPAEAGVPLQVAKAAWLRWKGASLKLRLPRCYQVILTLTLTATLTLTLTPTLILTLTFLSSSGPRDVCTRSCGGNQSHPG